VPLAAAAAQHPGPPLPRQGPAAAARRPAAALDERASAAPPGRDQGRAQARPGPARGRPRQLPDLHGEGPNHRRPLRGSPL